MEPARLSETHISYVFLVGDRAYKLKKPVRFDFVDLTTREAREAICRREVELNRRLSPDVYLGVLDVCDAEGRPVDHLVEMRRMPADRRLSTMVAEGRDVSACLRRLAHDLAAFHAAAATSEEIAEACSREAVGRNWDDNLAEMRRFAGPVLDGSVLDRIAGRAARYLAGRGPLFAARTDDGRSRDGHGDLLADDVFCLDDGPRALDCIEFNDRFRWGDVLADVAFLAMDLERLGARDLADRFLAWYREFSGESYPQSLADHYVAYRASVRAKVACLKHEQGDDASAGRARVLLDLCDARLADGRVRLVLVGGLPGTGKSTLAAGIAARTGWSVLRSDEIRKEIAGIPASESAHAGFGEGIYGERMGAETYAQMLARARSLLELGVSVVLDASWVHGPDRAAARELADRTSSDLHEVRCVLPGEVAERRMRERRASGGDASDADASIAAAMDASSDPWPEATELSTQGDPPSTLKEALAALTG